MVGLSHGAAVTAKGGAVSSPRSHKASLRLHEVGDALFWDGPTIEAARVPDRRACHVAGPCWEYDVHVPASRPGVALRVAATMSLSDPRHVRPWADFTAESLEMHFELQLYAPGADPAGDPTLIGENGHDGLHGYSRELTVGGLDATGSSLPPPSPGWWKIRLIPRSVTNMAVRLRAALLDETAPPEGTLLPDLRLSPPFELTFATPTATAGPGAATSHEGPRVSCMVEEQAEAVGSQLDPATSFAPPQLCLRFTMGLENVGAGTLDLVWERPADEVAAATQIGGATMRRQLQRACDYFGTTCQTLPDRGISTLFHWGHTHEHWVSAWSVELHRITDKGWQPGRPAPSTMVFSAARKLGISPYPELIADWTRFGPRTRPPAGRDDGCFADGGGGCSGVFPIQLEAGYADLYEWNRGGNYVEMPQGPARLTPSPGWYLLRAIADPLDLVAESNDTNNESYALFEVGADGAITLAERGYGSDPWRGRRSISTISP